MAWPVSAKAVDGVGEGELMPMALLVVATVGVGPVMLATGLQVIASNIRTSRQDSAVIDGHIPRCPQEETPSGLKSRSSIKVIPESLRGRPRETLGLPHRPGLSAQSS